MSAEDRPLLLYLPGLDGTGRLLHRQPGLWRDYHVECVGYPQEEARTYEQLADLAAARIEGAGGGPAVVLAESFGGAVALTLALRRPELVERMVLVNTFAWFPARLRIGLAAWLGRFLPSRPSPPSSRPFRGLFFFAPDIPSAERNEWWERTANVPMRAFGHRFRQIGRLDLRPRLKEIAAPCLVLAAPNDHVVPCAAGAALARGLPHARLLRLPVGHAALVHPRVDVARLLADPRYWPALPGTPRRAFPTAAAISGPRPG
jgi:pimeloyl-ACP methyl ester carboxylesterase